MTVRNGDLANETTFNDAFMSRTIKALGVGIEIDSTTEFSRPYPIMTTAQRDAITALEGDTLYNSDSKKLEVYNGSEWGEYDNVDSVNGKTGVVILDPDDLDDSATSNKFVAQADLDKLASIEDGAEVNTVDSVAGKTGDVILDRDDVGLDQVDNTSDSDKPVSLATQGALDLKANESDLTTHVDDYLAHKEVDTKANLDTWATTALNGSFAFATDEKKSYQVIDGVLTEIGGGAGGGAEVPTTYKIFNAEDGDITGLTNITINATNPINGLADYEVTSYPASFSDVNTFPRNLGKRNTLTIQYSILSGVAKVSISGGGMVQAVEAEIDNTSKEVVLEYAPLTDAALVLTVTDSDNATDLFLDDIEFSDAAARVKEFTVTNSVSLEGNDGRTITGNSEDIYFTGSGEGWTSLGDTNFYTAQYDDGSITIGGSVFNTTTDIVNIDVYKNGLYFRSVHSVAAASTVHNLITLTIPSGEFSRGDQFSLRFSATRTLQDNGTIHYLNIAETAKSSGTVFASSTNKEDIVVEGAGNAAQTLTGNITDIPFIEVLDNLGLWDGSKFTVPETGVYSITGMYALTSTAIMQTGLWIGENDTSTPVKKFNIGSTEIASFSHNFKTSLLLNKGQVVSVRPTLTRTLNNVAADHHIEITKQSVNVDNFIVENFGNVVAASTVGTGELENVFSARIANNGVASVTSQSSSFIQSVTRSSLGVVDVVFVSGFFSQIPQINVSSHGTNSRWVGVDGAGIVPTVNGFRTYMRRHDNVAEDWNFDVVVQRQGSDYKSKANYIDNLIIENPDGEFETVKKSLSADATSVGVMSDLTFSTTAGESYVLGGALTGVQASANNFHIEVTGLDTTAKIYYAATDSSNSRNVSIQFNEPFISDGSDVVFTIGGSLSTGRVYSKAGATNSEVALTKLPKKLGVDQLGQVVTNHVTGGTEYELKGQLWNGKQIYAKSFEILANISTTQVVTNFGIGLIPIEGSKVGADVWVVTDSTFLFEAPDYYYFDYRQSTGNISFTSSGRVCYAGTVVTLKYTKP